jgi:beta-1,4-mannosyltransferase
MWETFLPIALVISTIFTIILLLLPTRYVKTSLIEEIQRTGGRTSVQVLVLGDIGRSPRMQNHAISIAKHEGKVDVIGYQGNFSMHR